MYTSANNCKVRDSFLVGILRKPFQLFSRILNDVTSIKNTVPSVLISVEETGKNQLEPSQEGMEFAVLSQCSLLELLEQNRPLCWSIVVRENQLLVLHFSGRFLVTASSRRRRMSLYIYIFSFTFYVMQQVL
jgi:hypothetical protein